MGITELHYEGILMDMKGVFIAWYWKHLLAHAQLVIRLDT